jgi:hypothetical protein
MSAFLDLESGYTLDLDVNQTGGQKVLWDVVAASPTYTAILGAQAYGLKVYGPSYVFHWALDIETR